MASSPVKALSGAWTWLRARPLRLTLVCVVGAALGLRLAAPLVLERVIEVEASRVLGRAVDVGGVELSLLRGRVGVARFHAGPPLAEGERVAPLAPEEVRLGAARVAVDLSVADLLRGVVRVQEVLIDAPRVLRLRDAAGRLPPLLVASGGEASADEEAGAPPPVLLDRLRVTRARFFYFDAARPERVPFEVGVEQLDVEELSLSDGALQVARLDIVEPSLRVLDDFEATELEEDATASAPEASGTAAGEALPIHIGEVTLRDASLSLLGDAQRTALETRLAARATDVALGSGDRFPVELTLDVAEGRVAVAGKAGLGPLRFDGTATWSDLALGKLFAAVGSAGAALDLDAGTSHGKLDVSFTVADGAPLQLGGEAHVLDLAARDAEGLELEWEALDVGIESVRFELEGGAAPEVSLASVSLRAPKVLFARRVAAEAPADAPPASTLPRVRVARLDVTAGDVTFEDGSVKPAHRSRLRDLSIAGSKLRWPELRAASLRIDARSDDESQLQASATGGGEQTGIELSLARVGLSAFSPYIADASGYWVDRGQADFEARVELVGDRVKVDSDLVLHELAVTSVNPETFQKRFGMPLDVALALLRDPLGDIRLPLDFTVEGESSRVDVASLFIASLRQALIGAISTPLKGVSLLLPGGEDGSRAPGMAPVAFAPGALRFEAGDEVSRLVELLSARPGLAVKLRGGTVASDRGGIAQQLLGTRIAADAELPPVDAGILQRRRLERAAVARGRGDEAELSPDDERALAAWLAAVPVDAEAFEVFAGRRAEVLRAALLREPDIDETRVVMGKPVEDVGGVAIELVPVAR